LPNPGANHYFSMAALPHFPEDIQNKINNNKSAFLLGAQVMGLLKIYRPEKAERLKRIGADEYMQNIETIAKSSDAVLACAAGFLCAVNIVKPKLTSKNGGALSAVIGEYKELNAAVSQIVYPAAELFIRLMDVIGGQGVIQIHHEKLYAQSLDVLRGELIYIVPQKGGNGEFHVYLFLFKYVCIYA